MYGGINISPPVVTTVALFPISTPRPSYAERPPAKSRLLFSTSDWYMFFTKFWPPRRTELCKAGFDMLACDKPSPREDEDDEAEDDDEYGLRSMFDDDTCVNY
jgi:hypothetical protein